MVDRLEQPCETLGDACRLQALGMSVPYSSSIPAWDPSLVRCSHPFRKVFCDISTLAHCTNMTASSYFALIADCAISPGPSRYITRLALSFQSVLSLCLLHSMFCVLLARRGIILSLSVHPLSVQSHASACHWNRMVEKVVFTKRRLMSVVAPWMRCSTASSTILSLVTS